jgi:SAM-dependent methyltransferase
MSAESETGRAASAMDLDEQQVALSEVQDDDFRAANLNRMVAERLKPGTVIDVGCGGGGLLASLLERGYDACGIDVSPAIIEAAQGYLGSRGFEPTRVSAEPLEALVERGETFENVVSMDCLEHVDDDEAMFQQLVKLVRPGGGRLVITVPALMWLYGRRDRDIGHYRRYDRKRFEELLVGQPLIIEELRFWNGLGILPRVVTEKLLGRRMDESFRYGEPDLKKRVIRSALNTWFSTVERWVKPPMGLTLILKATRLL